MRKTSVYLTEAEAEGLREASLSSGRSQSELIREGVQQVLRSIAPSQRVFYGMGAGDGGGAPYTRWDADELYGRVMGQSD